MTLTVSVNCLKDIKLKQLSLTVDTMMPPHEVAFTLQKVSRQEGPLHVTTWCVHLFMQSWRPPVHTQFVFAFALNEQFQRSLVIFVRYTSPAPSPPPLFFL